MPSKTPQNPPRAPVIIEEAQTSVTIQLIEKKRDSKGKLVPVKSKTITVQHIDLTEAEARIRKALQG